MAAIGGMLAVSVVAGGNDKVSDKGEKKERKKKRKKVLKKRHDLFSVPGKLVELCIHSSRLLVLPY